MVCYMKYGMEQMKKSALKCMIKFDKFTNETKVVEIYGKSEILWKHAIFKDEAQFCGKCHVHKIVN